MCKKNISENYYEMNGLPIRDFLKILENTHDEKEHPKGKIYEQEKQKEK
jgi:hypothetical protein